MIPLTLFLLACGAIYVGTIQAAFNALMRVSLRLLAEGSGRSPVFERYLEEPLLLFLPLRTLLGILEGIVVVLLARMIGIGTAAAVGLLAVSMIAFGAVCEFLIPFLIVSRDPERVLELLLPSFRIISRPLEPITLGLLHLLNHHRYERNLPVAVNREDVNDDGEVISPTPEDADNPAADQQEERKLLKSIVDFTDTLVREVMTPRTQMVALPITLSLVLAADRVAAAVPAVDLHVHGEDHGLVARGLDAREEIGRPRAVAVVVELEHLRPRARLGDVLDRPARRPREELERVALRGAAGHLAVALGVKENEPAHRRDHHGPRQRQPQQRRAKIDLADIHQNVLADREAVDGAPVAAQPCSRPAAP